MSKDPFEFPIDLMGLCVNFEVMRDNVVISTVKGFFDSNNIIQIIDNFKIKSKDWLINDGDKYFITSVTPLPHGNGKFDYQLKYQEEYEYSQNISKQSQNSFSIGTVQGNAIIGNQSNATINVGASISDLKNLINSKPTEDHELLNKLVQRLEIIKEDNTPVSKGTLAKFSDLLAKHSDITNIVGNIITAWLTSR